MELHVTLSCLWCDLRRRRGDTDGVWDQHADTGVLAVVIPRGLHGRVPCLCPPRPPRTAIRGARGRGICLVDRGGPVGAAECAVREESLATSLRVLLVDAGWPGAKRGGRSGHRRPGGAVPRRCDLAEPQGLLHVNLLHVAPRGHGARICVGRRHHERNPQPVGMGLLGGSPPDDSVEPGCPHGPQQAQPKTPHQNGRRGPPRCRQPRGRAFAQHQREWRVGSPIPRAGPCAGRPAAAVPAARAWRNAVLSALPVDVVRIRLVLCGGGWPGVLRPALHPEQPPVRSAMGFWSGECRRDLRGHRCRHGVLWDGARWAVAGPPREEAASESSK
mmetsp:Transcript_25162/g.75774  ORF Transcript_25162/g.75774 Transcript_25162/m.75774 type:complete len:331 (+) Transcript_25162:250-1242(+)